MSHYYQPPTSYSSPILYPQQQQAQNEYYQHVHTIQIDLIFFILQRDIMHNIMLLMYHIKHLYNIVNKDER